jgi:hypothetical protein
MLDINVVLDESKVLPGRGGPAIDDLDPQHGQNVVPTRFL